MTLKTQDFRQGEGDWKWFAHDRFGMFIHWGLYSAAARHEWVKNLEEIEDEDYERYFRYFDPDMFQPEAWADAAVQAGMKYFVVTTKHHEGFCLWDSRHTAYKAANTPAGRDLLRPLVEAFRSRGLKVGFYYSLLDWHHPHFTVDDLHPRLRHPERARLNEGRDMSIYAAYMRDQVRELLTDFGQIDILWFDFSYKDKGHEQWESEKLYAMIRELQPHIMINDRLDLPEGWDFTTPEQEQPEGWVEKNGRRCIWEACHTFSGNAWGYSPAERRWKSAAQVVYLLVDSVSKGGNLLFNVGPTARGNLDDRTVACLQKVGEWMKYNGPSVYGCTSAPEGVKCDTRDARLTWNPESGRLYVHLTEWPRGKVVISGLNGGIAYARFLHDASEIKLSKVKGDGDSVAINLPQYELNTVMPVVELLLK